MSALDMFNQFRELANHMGDDMKFSFVYMDKDGNMTKMSSDDVKSKNPEVPKMVYDLTFFQALKELHTCESVMYIEEKETKVRISLDDDGQYKISRLSSAGLFVNNRDMNGKWGVKYSCIHPKDIPNTTFTKPNCTCKRDAKGRFTKND